MPKLIYDVEFQISGVSGSADFRLEEQIQDVQQLRNALDLTEEQFSSLVKTAKKGSVAMKGFGGSGKNVNKQFAGANQAVFAFNDLVQDSTQFSMGFSQGMRAIGNNVAFAGELFGNLQQKVDLYNQSLSDADRAAGKSTTVFKEVKKSMSGIGGAIFAANAAFLIFQVTSDLVKKTLKGLNDQAKANAEAFGEVASEFSKFESGIDDPLGFRARERELRFLRLEVEKLDPEKARQAVLQSLSAMGPVGQGLAGLAAVSSGVSNSMFGLATAMGLVSDETYIAIQANEELRIEYEKVKQTQKAFQNFLKNDATPAFRSYVSLTEMAEKISVRYSAGLDMAEEAMFGVFKSTDNQISALRAKNQLSEEEIMILQKLLRLRGQLGKQISQQAQVKQEIDNLEATNNILSAQNDLIGQNNVLLQISGEENIAKMEAERKFANEMNALNNALYEGNITAGQFELKQQKLMTQQKLELAEAEINARQRVREAYSQGALQALQDTQMLNSALSSLSQQRVQNAKQALEAGRISQAEYERIARKEFETQKKLQLASAIVNAAGGIASAFTPYIPVVSEARAAIVAAATAAQIKTIRETQFDSGSSTPSTNQRSASNGGFITRRGEQDPPQTRSTFTPRRRDVKPDMNVVVEQKTKNSQLALTVRAGNQRVRSQQTTYRKTTRTPN